MFIKQTIDAKNQNSKLTFLHDLSSVEVHRSIGESFLEMSN